MTDTTTMTADEAMRLALDYAEGRRSCLNEMMNIETSFDHRQETLVAVEQCDNQSVQKWCSIAETLGYLKYLEHDTRP